MKKIINILNTIMIIFIIISLFSNVLAADLETKLDIIQKSSETIYLENNQGYITKSIVDSDAENGEVTIELKLSNTAKDTEVNKRTEIFLVLDNSISMDYMATETETRKSVITNAATNLINNIYSNNSNVDIGIVRFASKRYGTVSGTDKEYYQPNAANLMQELTNNKSNIINTISEYNEMDTEAGTNIYAGLKKAYENFSSDDTNKIIILLTDGLPTEYTESYYDYASQDEVDSDTRDYIEKVGNEVTLISLMTGLVLNEDEDSEDIERVTQIFGTNENPTAGYFYNISDADIDKIVNNDILQNVMDIVQNPINNVKIVDYFPEDIMDNFDFSYVGSPNIGEVSESIDSNNIIEWDIGTLRGDEVATLRYKLEIKDMKNQNLLNKTISTNEKVTLNYIDSNEEEYTVTLSSSPKIQLSEVEEQTNTNTVNKDDTTAPGKIPQTGVEVGTTVVIASLVIASLVMYLRFRRMKDMK